MQLHATFYLVSSNDSSVTIDKIELSDQDEEFMPDVDEFEEYAYCTIERIVAEFDKNKKHVSVLSEDEYNAIQKAKS